METPNQAQWLINSDGWYPYCSRCGHEPKNGVTSKYCPDCGAIMENTQQSTTTRISFETLNDLRKHISFIQTEMRGFADSYSKNLIVWRLEEIEQLLAEVR